MSTGPLAMYDEFFSVRGCVTGAIGIAAVLVLQSIIGFPDIWIRDAIRFMIYIAVSAAIVGIASGSVLVYLIPPDQDVIGVAGLGSDAASQHLSLLLVITALLQPMFTGYLFFFEFFGHDALSPIWVIAAFAVPALGLVVAMYDRQSAVTEMLREYFHSHERLDLVSLDWLQEAGPRTAVYRMGMLERAASRIEGVRVVGHEIVREQTLTSAGTH